MSTIEYVYSVKKYQDDERKDIMVYEVCVRMIGTIYGDYPMSVGDEDRPYRFKNETDATADCLERIAEKLAAGHNAHFEAFNYT